MRKYIDKKLFFILIAYMAAYHMVYISRRAILKVLDHEAYMNLSWWRAAFDPIVANFSIVPPIIILVLVATKIMINRQLSWIYVVLVHFVFFVMYASLLTAFSVVYQHLFFNAQLDIFSINFLIVVLFGSNLNFLGYVGFVTIIYSYHFIHKTAKVETQKAKLSQQLQLAKMEALKSQLNPHFLFNTMNSISSLIKVDAHKAQHMIGNLGDLLREILLVSQEDMIPVFKEMIILNKYIEIMQTRFSDHLTVYSTIDKEVEEALVPSMLIQPILENSFKHGYSYDSTNLRVDLSISRKDKWLLIQIRNNGALISKENGTTGLGIKNIRERLETLFIDNFEFSFSNLENKSGVFTEIKIPFKLA